jgi:hypothetical protein
LVRSPTLSLGSAPLASFRSPASVSGDDECSK